MKASNKLVAAGVIVFIALLVAYDKSLQAAYKTQAYRDERRTFTSIESGDFDAIEVHTARFAGIRISQGPCKVMVDKKSRSFVNLKKVGRRLILNVESSLNFQADLENSCCLFISCPVLSQLHIDNSYRQNGVTVTDSIGGGYAYYPKITLLKFVQDSMSVTEGDVSYLKLDSCKIGYLNAVVGDEKAAWATMNIPQGNTIGRATFTILDGANLVLSSIPASANYHLSAKADVNLSGSVLNSMLTSK